MRVNATELSRHAGVAKSTITHYKMRRVIEFDSDGTTDLQEAMERIMIARQSTALPDGYVSQADLARHLGTVPSVIHSYKKRGILTPDKNGLFHLKTCQDIIESRGGIKSKATFNRHGTPCRSCAAPPPTRLVCADCDRVDACAAEGTVCKGWIAGVEKHIYAPELRGKGLTVEVIE